MTPERLEQAHLPAPVLEVLSSLTAAGHRAFLVGGCVRDALRGSAAKDYDIATSAKPEQVQSTFNKVIPTGIEHGTVTVVVKGVHVEVTTFRAEAEYLDGRRPSKVEFHEDIEADLARRDFTINAMAYDPIRRELVDPFEGQKDLRARLIRCVRSATERFSEDGLRAMRAVRFATVLDFTLETQTKAAIAPTVPIFRKVALERVNQELVKLLVAQEAATGLQLLDETTLLEAFLPEAKGGAFDAVGRAPRDLVTRLAVLLAHRPAEVKTALLRIKCSTHDAQLVEHLLKNITLPELAEEGPELRRWLAKVTPEHAPRALDVVAALTGQPPHRSAVERIIAARPPLTSKDLALDGKAIMAALNVGPSKAVGDATRHLLELVLDDPAKNTVEVLTPELKAWFKP